MGWVGDTSGSLSLFSRFAAREGGDPDEAKSSSLGWRVQTRGFQESQVK